MGTRASILIKYTKCSLPFVHIYVQCDGYLSGVGQQLYDILKNHKIINGIGMNQDISNSFNGLSCMAAWITKELKEHIGNVYLQSPFDFDYRYQDYLYKIWEKDGMIMIGLGHWGKFSDKIMTMEEFGILLKEENQ